MPKTFEEISAMRETVNSLLSTLEDLNIMHPNELTTVLEAAGISYSLSVSNLRTAAAKLAEQAATASHA